MPEIKRFNILNLITYLRRSGKRKQHYDEDATWIWELLALSTSIVSLTAIIVTAANSHGKPVAKLPLGITLNAAISIFATIMKSTILYCASEVISRSKWIWFHRQPKRLGAVELYDQASRGPWGALAMMWHVRWKSVCVHS